MRSADIVRALDVGQKWTRQVKTEEKRPSARTYRESMWTVSRVSLTDICEEHMPAAWDKASDGGRLPTHWRQIFYVMRPICDEHPESDRPLRDTTFKNIIEQYLDDHAPGWDVLRGARGVFKEPHAPEADSGLPMSTMNVRGYLQGKAADPRVKPFTSRFPTHGAHNRIAGVLICEKEGFDELLMAEQIPERYDLALMSTKGISAKAARNLADALAVDAPCFTLHDLDKNGFVMASGFPDAIDIGIRMGDVTDWDLVAEEQLHTNPPKTYRNMLRNGATPDEARFVSEGERVELNMFTSPQLVKFIEGKLLDHGVEKVIPDDDTLEAAWKRARILQKVNGYIDRIYNERASDSEPESGPVLQNVPSMPGDMAARIRRKLNDTPTQSWDDALWDIAFEATA